MSTTVTINTTGGAIELAKSCLPPHVGYIVGNDCTKLFCSESVRLVRCRANQIMQVAEEQMFLHPETVSLVFSSMTYFELVVGSDSAVFSTN